MGYQIGQLRDADISSSMYFTAVSVNKRSDIVIKVSNILSGDIEFKEVGLSSTNPQWMLPQRNYYLNFSISRYEEGYFKDPFDPQVDTLDFTLCLLVDGDVAGEYEVAQIIDSYTILPYPVGDTDATNRKANFEVLFTPIQDNITRIGFIRKKRRYDYMGSGAERTLLLTVNSYGIVNNLLPYVPGMRQHQAEKIGVQSKPGFYMCINGEPIRVGKSGVYEINNGLNISFFGTPITDEHFLLDCAWTD